MTGWIIFGCILLVLIWLFTRSVTVTAVYDKDPELRVKILFFTLVRVPPDKEKQKKKAARQKAKEEKLARKEARKAAKKQPAHGNRALLAEAEEAEKATEAPPETQETETGSKAPEEPDSANKAKIKKPKKNNRAAFISFPVVIFILSTMLLIASFVLLFIMD